MRRITFWTVLGLTLAFAVACSAASAPAEEAVESAPAEEEVQSEVEAAVAPEEAEEEAEEEVEEAEAASEVIAVSRPSEPAPPDAYREDSAELVGATGNVQLIEFFTYWCNTCKAYRPDVHALEAEYWGKVDFVYLDRENPDNADIVTRFGILYQPVFILVEPDGTEIRRWVQFEPDLLGVVFDSHLSESGA